MSVPNSVPPTSASLYVGDLKPDVSEGDLYNVFTQIANIASVRVCRDAQTKQSLGYAYVNYFHAADAERALDKLNYHEIKGRPCRVMWSNRDPSSRKSGKGNVFVRNLDRSYDTKALYDTFHIFGEILSCKVATDAEGRSLGYGFVHFADEKCAEKAMNHINGYSLGNKQAHAVPFLGKRERVSDASNQFTNVYTKNFPDSWTKEDFSELFGAYGSITSINLTRDSRGRPYGHVNFSNNSSAKAAIAGLNERITTEHGVMSQQESDELKANHQNTDIVLPMLYVSRAQTKAERQAALRDTYNSENIVSPTGENLYVKNLSEDVDDNALLEMFQRYGPVTSAKVMRDSQGHSRCFGFVSFHNAEDAAKAVTDLHSQTIQGKPLYVTVAEKREHRVARLQSRMKNPRPGMMPHPGYGMPMHPPYVYHTQMAHMSRHPMNNYVWKPGTHPQMPIHPPAMQQGRYKAIPMQAPADIETLKRSLQEAKSHEQKRNIMGEVLYKMVAFVDAEYAGKVTGMMLELPEVELLRLMAQPQELGMKVHEARSALLSNIREEESRNVYV